MRGIIYLAAAILALVPAITVLRTDLAEQTPALRIANPPYASVDVSAPDDPPPIPEPPPVKPGWTKAVALEQAVREAMAEFTGRYSVVVHELASGEQWRLNEADRYHPASTIKLPVTLFALEQYRAGKLNWHDVIRYTEADFESPGGGAFETTPFGGYWPVENLVGRALRYSNNVAVNMLGRHLGWDNIRAWSRTIDGELYRLSDSTPEVTPMSELGWWLHLERVAREDPDSARLLLGPLGDVDFDGRIAAGLPEGTPHLHKFGSYDGYYHDGGWIQGEHPYLLIIMTHGATVDEADVAIARVTTAIHAVMIP